jgi:hypothetical protein
VAFVSADEWAKVGRYFNGVDEYVTGDVAPASSHLTIEGWFIWLAGQGALLRDATPVGGWSLGHDVDGHLAYTVAGTTRITATPVDSLRSGWHHHVLTKDGDTVAYYLDSVCIDTWSGGGDGDLAVPWTLMHDAAAGTFIEGFAADFALYEHALPVERVIAHWEAGKDRY